MTTAPKRLEAKPISDVELVERSLTHVSDVELVERSLTHDRWARGKLYDRHAGVLAATVTRILGRKDPALDIVHDSFLYAFEHLTDLRDKTRFRSWLFRIGISRTRSALRKEGLRGASRRRSVIRSCDASRGRVCQKAKRDGYGNSSRLARWRQLSAAGEYRAAYREVAPKFQIELRRAANVETLFALADTARLSGHPAEARGPLERIVRESPADRRAGVAAFTLGKIELESFHRPQVAQRWFERAIALGLTPSLSRSARHRLDTLRVAGESAP